MLFNRIKLVYERKHGGDARRAAARAEKRLSIGLFRARSTRV
jgi:hypothetical protein